ncbi:MAG: FHA domain-containing protein [Gammaproteobacteria bacterium]|nr:FHA domain-containing protein [Gammaproteobacteria bacterium]
MENGTYTIGRKDRRRGPRLGPEARRGRRTNVIWLNHDTVSNVHAELDVLNDRFFLRDLNSTNGIFRDEEGKKVRFKEGYVELDQVVFLGDLRCTVRELLEHI